MTTCGLLILTGVVPVGIPGEELSYLVTMSWGLGVPVDVWAYIATVVLLWAGLVFLWGCIWSWILS